jgi:hypothetical protein
MKIPFMINLEALETGPREPIDAYGERFHHVPPLWYYRWMDEEQIDALCRRALEEDRPVESWAITRWGSWAWGEPPGKGPPPGMRL